MDHEIYCFKLKKKALGLSQPPYKNDLGQKIYDNICQEAWNMWLERQTMIINEYRLSCFDPKARSIIFKELEMFLFGDGGVAPSGYRDPDT
jgi:Fe-S cluster biosynthesis and repair protein YggX